MVIDTATIIGIGNTAERYRILCLDPLIIFLELVPLVYTIGNASFYHLDSNGLFWENLQRCVEVGLSKPRADVQESRFLGNEVVFV
jgi:hypothetical protein